MTNSEITQAARNQLEGKWLNAVLAFFIISILPSLILLSLPAGIEFDVPTDSWSNELNQPFHFRTNVFYTSLINGALEFGGAFFSLTLIRGGKADVEHVFVGFKDLNRFFVFLAANILRGVFILLWSLLFIIPGIIAALSYSMTYYILADHPNMGSWDAISQSKILMRGHKWQLFKLYMRFVGLGMLCILTLGIGFFWLVPYANICLAEFYESIIKENQ